MADKQTHQHSIRNVYRHFMSEEEAYLQLICAGLATHHMAAGAECSIDLLLAAKHAQQSLPELLQPLLQGSALLAAATVQPLVLRVVLVWGE